MDIASLFTSDSDLPSLFSFSIHTFCVKNTDLSFVSLFFQCTYCTVIKNVGQLLSVFSVECRV